jgi:O-acetyl-ADP-ribose deacetylase (regulator of RNase III)
LFWFICETEALKRRFREETLSIATERLRHLAREAGFPRSSTDTLQTDVTSSEEIEAGGGRFYFFR